MSDPDLILRGGNVADDRESEIAVLIDDRFTGQVRLAVHGHGNLVAGNDAIVLRARCLGADGACRTEREDER